MINKIYHVCDENKSGIPLKFSLKNKEWEVEESKELKPCKYCPHCGIKLPSEIDLDKDNERKLDSTFLDKKGYFFFKKFKNPIWSIIGFR